MRRKQSYPAAVVNLLQAARRFANEACALEPDAVANWETLLRVFLALESGTPATRHFIITRPAPSACCSA